MTMKRPRIKKYTKVEIPNNMEEENDFKILDLSKEVADENFSDPNQTEKSKNKFLGNNSEILTEEDNEHFSDSNQKETPTLPLLGNYLVMLKVVADEQFSDSCQEIALSEALKSKSTAEIGDRLFKVNGQISPYLFIRHRKQRINQINDESYSPTLKIPGFMSKTEIYLKKGWTNFTFRFFDLLPDKSVNEVPYYKEEIINGIENSPKFRRYLETVQNVDEMLRWFDKTDMTKWEFLDAVNFTIPVMPKEALIINACYSYNGYIDNNPSYDGFEIDGIWYAPTHADPENDDEMRLAKICLDYLRHKRTPYNLLLYRFCKWEDPESDEFHDKLKYKVNTAICDVYPWIRMNIGPSY